MPIFTAERELRSGKGCNSFTPIRINELKNSEKNDFRNAHRSNSDFKSEPHFSTQDAVYQHVTKYISPLTKQSEDLTRLTREISRAH